MIRTAAAIVRKDLRLELRNLETLPAMTLFVVSAFVLFHYALDRDELAGSLASGVLWVTLLFGALLGINRLFVAEREQGGFDAFLLAPVDRTALLVAKASVLFVFLVLVEIVALAAFSILLLGPSIWAPLPELALILVLADAGLAVIGTLVAALAIQTRARDLIVPLMVLPLSVPLVIAAANATAPLLAAGGAHALQWRWPATLALYAVVFGLLAYALFDFLLED